MSSTDERRPTLQAGLLSSYRDEAKGLIEAGDYEAAVVQFEKMTELLSREQLAPGAVPLAFESIVRFVATEASKRGDEARTLSALMLLSYLDDDSRYRKKYERVSAWGVKARAPILDLFQRYGELIEVWDGHARLTPHGDVLDNLVRLHIERRDAADRATRGLESSPRRTMAMRARRLAPIDVATVYLRQADIDAAIARLESMGSASDADVHLLKILKRARNNEADAVVELVEGFRFARPEVAHGLCKDGLTRFPKDYRFPMCMARVAAESGEFGDAAGWYGHAISLAPQVQDLYDEALSRINRFIEQKLVDTNPVHSRALATRAARILSERQKRWPDSDPPLPAERLEFLVAMLEMNAGNAKEAQRRLQSSLSIAPSDNAHYQLGLLLLRVGDARAGEQSLNKALAMTPTTRREHRLRRAEILQRLGDAASAQGMSARARNQYKKALAFWTQESEGVEGAPLALLEIHRGVLFDRLGRHSEAVASFHAAMAAAPQWRETYASILSHIVVSEPDEELAALVWRRAQLQLTLPPEWKVYFTLWMQAINARAGAKSDPDLRDLLKRLGRSPTWWGKLAKFGAGQLVYAKLLADANGLGEEAEAHFYEGARLLAGGDAGAAKRLFDRVLTTRMVNFYEYEMARSLIQPQASPR